MQIVLEAIEAKDFWQSPALITALSENMDGLSEFQAGIMSKMADMLNEAVRIVRIHEGHANADILDVAHSASSKALAIRMHGTVLRGPQAATMLEELADFARLLARLQGPAMGTLDAIRMMGFKTRKQLATSLGIEEMTVYGWGDTVPDAWKGVILSQLPDMPDGGGVS